jgi:hypothetical protein
VVKDQQTNNAPRLLVGPACLLFFIDETGHETFADENYPVLGLGGCAITSSSADAVIAQPWRAMKAQHFGGEISRYMLTSFVTPHLNSWPLWQNFFASSSSRGLP